MHFQPLLQYRGALYRSALKLEEGRKRLIKEVRSFIQAQYLWGHNFPLIRYDALQELYDYLVDKPKLVCLATAIENADLTQFATGTSVEEFLKDAAYECDIEASYDAIERTFNKIAEQVAAPLVATQIDKLVGRIDAYMRNVDGKSCYRLIRLQPGQNPVKLPRIGKYWSVDAGRVGNYWSTGPGIYWRFRARIDAKVVDAYRTLKANMNLERGDEEREVTMKEGAKIWVYDVQEIKKYNPKGNEPHRGIKFYDYELGPKRKIDAWRVV